VKDGILRITKMKLINILDFSYQTIKILFATI